ncbi:exodeoxyribonuclease VII large subunit, partial [Belnapia moabensis]|uniref:exodeoxyribonuclease VII large subunit n=1 Tax=Belnapia moabensis TaxID=365533 RepID=UPI00248003C1
LALLSSQRHATPAIRVLERTESSQGDFVNGLLEAGSKVLVKIASRLDANYGYSVEIEDIDPSYSLGDLKARAEAIRRRLKEGGIWERNRRLRRPLNFFRVAVISPPGAAGLGDFRSTVDRLTSAGLVEFTFVEAPFQTPGAAARIVAEMRNIYRSHQAAPFCALAIIRGGGAAADLAYLVDYKLAEAVCKMPMLVMTGIGHERDQNLIDEVACLPLDTPSKMAEHIKGVVVGAAQAAHGAITDIHSQVRLAVAHAERASPLPEPRSSARRAALWFPPNGPCAAHSIA